MIPHYILKQVIGDQLSRFSRQDPGIPRRIDIQRYQNRKRIVVITGVRRCGKSTLLKQLSFGSQSFLYLNADDDRLIGATSSDLGSLLLIWEEIMPGVRTVFIDEIQNIPGWERVIRRMHDEGYRIILTGSNAQMLSAELGTHLTGRYVRIELFPFAFDEFCRFFNVHVSPLDIMTTEGEAAVIRHFSRYIEEGGFPEFLCDPDTEILRRTFDDILFRDVIGRYGIREVMAFRQLCRYLYANMTREASFASLASIVQMKSSLSIKNWIGYLEDAYLIKGLCPYEYSMKKQLSRNRKYYGIDTGMRSAVSFRFSEDSGLLLENVVCTELRRQGSEIYWWKGHYECDFIVVDRGQVVKAIQVCWYLSDENREREIGGVMEVLNRFSGCEGFILTLHQEEMTFGGIKILPAWKWILQGSEGGTIE